MHVSGYLMMQKPNATLMQPFLRPSYDAIAHDFIHRILCIWIAFPSLCSFRIKYPLQSLDPAFLYILADTRQDLVRIEHMEFTTNKIF